jgi:RNA polymerase sigma-70 factor (ECF subfamily)
MALPLPNYGAVFDDGWGAARPRESDLGAPHAVCYARGMTTGSAPDPLFVAEVLRHVDALHNFARYLTRDAIVAEDLVQDTFARCLSAHGKFAQGTNSKAWMFRILRNAFIDGARRNRNNPARRGLDAADASDDDLRDAEPLRGDIEIERLRGIVAEDIEAALAELSADARMVVLMDLEGFSEAEIAGVMDCPLGTIKSRLSRARGALRELLKDYAR